MTVLDRHGANRTISKKREVSRVIRQNIRIIKVLNFSNICDIVGNNYCCDHRNSYFLTARIFCLKSASPSESESANLISLPYSRRSYYTIMLLQGSYRVEFEGGIFNLSGDNLLFTTPKMRMASVAHSHNWRKPCLGNP